MLPYVIVFFFSCKTDTATITIVNTIVSTCEDLDVVWVWVTDAVTADTLHDATIEAVELLEASHVVICTIVDGASLWALALLWFV